MPAFFPPSAALWLRVLGIFGRGALVALLLVLLLAGLLICRLLILAAVLLLLSVLVAALIVALLVLVVARVVALLACLFARIAHLGVSCELPGASTHP
jgi:hypothetical protein